MPAKRTPKTLTPHDPPTPSGLEALRQYGDHLKKAVDFMTEHLEDEVDPAKRDKLSQAIVVGYFEAICAMYIPECRTVRSKERALVEEMATQVDWSETP